MLKHSPMADIHKRIRFGIFKYHADDLVKWNWHGTQFMAHLCQGRTGQWDKALVNEERMYSSYFEKTYFSEFVQLDQSQGESSFSTLAHQIEHFPDLLDLPYVSIW